MNSDFAGKHMLDFSTVFLASHMFNPLKCSGVRWLHFKVLSAIHV